MRVKSEVQQESNMTERSEEGPMNRFLEFMIADIEGDQSADELAREMVVLEEAPPYFLEMRQKLRTCRSVEEMHRVYRSMT